MMLNSSSNPRDSAHFGPMQLRALLVTEFVGTFISTFTFCSSWARGDEATVWQPTSVGLVTAVLVYALGELTGGMLNPAVSILLGLLGRLDWRLVLHCCAVQIAAAALGTGICLQLFPGLPPAPLQPKSGYQMWEAALVEAFGTAFVCFVYASCALGADSCSSNGFGADRNQYDALAVGFAAIAASCAAIGVSSACLNPALSLIFGLGWDGMGMGIAYVSSELVGVLLAAFCICLLHPLESPPLFWRKAPSGVVMTLVPHLSAELLGTMLITTTFCWNLVTRSRTLWWSVAGAVVSMVYSMWNVSGGQLNPAVTVGAMCCEPDLRRMGQGTAYLAVQLLGSVVAGLLTVPLHAFGPAPEESFGILPNPGFSWSSVFAVETLFSMLSVATFLCVAREQALPSQTIHRNHLGFAAGASVLVGGLAAAPITGAQLNPAITVAAWIADVFAPGNQPPVPMSTVALLGSAQMLGGCLAGFLIIPVLRAERPQRQLTMAEADESICAGHASFVEATPPPLSLAGPSLFHHSQVFAASQQPPVLPSQLGSDVVQLSQIEALGGSCGDYSMSWSLPVRIPSFSDASLVKHRPTGQTDSWQVQQQHVQQRSCDQTQQPPIRQFGASTTGSRGHQLEQPARQMFLPQSAQIGVNQPLLPQHKFVTQDASTSYGATPSHLIASDSFEDAGSGSSLRNMFSMLDWRSEPHLTGSWEHFEPLTPPSWRA